MLTLWTALPNGLTGDPANRHVRLSVYVSMRLDNASADGSGTLGLFPAALAWPSLLQPGALTLQVQAGSAAPVTATVVSAPPDPALWQALFSAATPVTSHGGADNFTGRPINTYSAAALHDDLRRGHQTLSTVSAVAPPTRRQLQGAFPALEQALRAERTLPASPDASASLARQQQFHLLLGQTLLGLNAGSDIHEQMRVVAVSARQLAAASPAGTLVPVVATDGTEQTRFAQLYAFHYRAPVDARHPPIPAPTVEPARVLDFHQALTALAQYPQLLRRLGLVIDLELRESALPGAPLSGPAGTVQILPQFASPRPSFQTASPATAYVLDGDRIFTAAPRTPARPETIAGLLNLAASDQYQLIQVDVDGLAMKTLNMVASSANRASTSNLDEPSDGLAPARSPGLSIQRIGHAAVLTQRFATALQNDAQLRGGTPPILFDEDLTRGFRFDVLDATSGWRSLHARTGTYVFSNHPAGPTTLTLADEGFAHPAATQRPDADPDVQAQLYIHESLAHWQGWSLSAPRPGKTIGDAGPADVSNSTSPGGFGVTVNFAATPGTLPRLRFQRDYQLRARAVDLAGNSSDLGGANDALALLHTLNRPLPVLPAQAGDFTYRRFEPVVAPHLVARERFTEGESLARLVIRSNRGESAAACASRLMALVAASRPPAAAMFYGAVNERHVVPPKTSLLSVETHGLLDAAFGPSGDPVTVYNLARKEKGRLTDTAIIDVTTGNSAPIPDTGGIDPVTGGVISRPAVEFVETANDANGPNGYAVHHEEQLALPWLPDPLARGASLFSLPGVEAGQSGIVDAGQTLVFVPSTLPPTSLAILRSITQIDFGAGWPSRLPFRIQMAEPLTPDGPAAPPIWDAASRVLTVHLAKAEQVSVRLSAHLASGDLDALGVWRWLLDRQATIGMPPPDAGDAETAVAGGVWMLTPFTTLDLVHAVQQPLQPPQFNALASPRDTDASFAYFGASLTIHGKSTGRLDIQARWQETLDDTLQAAPVVRSLDAHLFDFSLHLPEEGGAVAPMPPNQVPLASYDNVADVVTFLVPAPGDLSGRHFNSRHEFGDTRHRRVIYRCIASTRFREYFPPEVTADSSQISLGTDAAPIDVPSSARPAAPVLVEAVPLFEWSRSIASDGSLVRQRKGGGIRVYLERPWFSSGEGELLAVVLVDAGRYPPADNLRPLVSEWGNDPIWASAPLLDAPLPSSFPLSVASASGIALAEGVPPGVELAGHTVAFDADRRLWFSDIRVDAGQVYSPMIRLALARYQPFSLPGLELSRVVRSDFLPILPDRTVTASPVAGDPNSVNLVVTGLSYQGSAWNPGPEEFLGDAEIIHPTPQVQELLTPPSLVTVSLEQRVPGAVDEAGWQAFAAPITVIAAVTADNPVGTTLWNGSLALPAPRQPGQYRVVILEHEHLPSDQRVVLQVTVHVPADPDVPHSRPHNEVRTLTFTPGAGRLVFAETIEF